MQRDSMQCGVACLCMVARWHGIKCNLPELDEVCHATTEGVSLKSIADGATALGLKTKGAKLSIEQLINTPLPAILHWNQNHFVTLYKIDRKGERYHVADPAKGKVTYTREEFTKHWIPQNVDDACGGIAMFFQKDSNVKANPHETLDKDKNDSIHSFSFILKYLTRYRKSLSIILASLLTACILQLILPFLTQAIVDIGINRKQVSIIWLILLGEFMIVIGRTATDFIRRWLLLHISMRINISLVSDFFIKLLKLPMSFFDTKLMGDLMQRIGDHGRIQGFLTGQVLNILFTMVSFCVFGMVLALYNITIFTVFAIGSIIYGIWIASFLARRKVLDYQLFEQQAINQNRTFQFITSMQEIKLQDCERRRRWEWEDTQADLFLLQLRAQKLQQTQEAGSIFINEIKNILITVLTATAVIHEDMTLGGMMAVQYIIGQLNSPVEQFMSFIYSVQDVKISLERINEIHNGTNEDTPQRQVRTFASHNTISMHNVNFKYDPHAIHFTLKDISLTIPAGKVTAIVGASGSGKTTLIKLLLGYYTLTNGHIDIAGRNLNDYNLKWWRQHCGVVMQEGIIFSESIARNIAVDDGEIDTARLMQAARIANIHDYVMSLPLKYNTKIGHDGVGISQGQKQRILIARAVYKNPDFIFLDEATNALDAKNERTIVENLNEFYKGRTVVVVAHRLSTVKNADQIIVLDGGKVAETGDHITLIKRKGAYYNLIKNQLELGE